MWIWASSGGQGRTEEPGVLRSTGRWGGGHGLATEEQHRLLAQSLRPALWFWGLGFPSELICQWKKPATRSCRHQSLSPCCLSVCQGHSLLLKDTCISSHVAPSTFKPAVVCQVLLKFLLLLLRWLHCDYTEPIQIIQANLPIVK